MFIVVSGAAYIYTSRNTVLPSGPIWRSRFSTGLSATLVVVTYDCYCKMRPKLEFSGGLDGEKRLCAVAALIRTSAMKRRLIWRSAEGSFLTAVAACTVSFGTP